MRTLIRATDHHLPRPANTILISLRPSPWDDFGYKTLFYLSVIDTNGTPYSIGDVKIGTTLSLEDGEIVNILEDGCDTLGSTFFSLGQDANYYHRLSKLGQLGDAVLVALRDIVAIPAARVAAESLVGEYNIFSRSLLRTVSYQTILEQYSRVLSNNSIKKTFNFRYSSPTKWDWGGVSLDFSVAPNSNPPTNIHVLIGSNGAGKTKLLNSLARCVVEGDGKYGENGYLSDNDEFGQTINYSYFSNVISTSFSVFDQDLPPKRRDGGTNQVSYYHVGLKSNIDNELRFKKIVELREDFVISLQSFWGLNEKHSLWNFAIDVLRYVPNFPSDTLAELNESQDSYSLAQKADALFKDLSSGHAVVLFTIAKIVERAEEKTLILIDEPENHLHPPLLSGFIRVISGILSRCNGVAIIATHSPVVLQEVPSNCVWKIYRSGSEMMGERPAVETFGENVGTLTRDVFGLQVEQTGFHQLLSQAIETDMSYEEILYNFSNQIGIEGRALLRALIISKRFE